MRYVENPPNPWLTHTVEWIGEPPEARLEVFEEEATRTIITENNSPDVGFKYSVNLIRGCSHACIYCFSRPTHEYGGSGINYKFSGIKYKKFQYKMLCMFCSVGFKSLRQHNFTVNSNCLYDV